jgi:transposase
MGDVITIGLDIAKASFQAHGADASGAVVFRKKLTRGRLLAFLAAQPRCLVAMEACAGAHHWGRELVAMGHTYRPAQLRQSTTGRTDGSIRPSDRHFSQIQACAEGGVHRW